MKGLLIFFIIFSINSCIWAQETKLITKTRNDYSEEYYVLKSDHKTKHGRYIRYTTGYNGIQILQLGYYSNGLKNGMWEYYNKFPHRFAHNSIKEKGRYVDDKKNGVWLSYYLDTIPEITNVEKFGNKQKTDSISLNIEQQSAKLKIAGMYLNDRKIGEWTSFNHLGEVYQKYDFYKQKVIVDKSLKDTLKYNTDRCALFVGGLTCLGDFLIYERGKDFFLNLKESDSVSVVVSFKIDRNGNVSETKIDKSNSFKTYEQEALRIVNLTDKNWIPAVSNGQKIDSIYRILFYTKRRNGLQGSYFFRTGYIPLF